MVRQVKKFQLSFYVEMESSIKITAVLYSYSVFKAIQCMVMYISCKTHSFDVYKMN